MEKLKCTNPFTGENIGEFNYDSFPQALEKLKTLKKNQKAWNEVALKERLTLVKEALAYFDKNREQIALDICEEIGRPLHHSRGELNGFFERANYLCEIAEATLQPDQIAGKPNFDRQIEHVAYGTIFVISAWNYPLLITVNSVVPALISGNTVLLKHSSLTPKIGAHFEKAFRNLGPHRDLLMQTIINHETTGRLIEEGPVDHVVFTGSVSGGQSILKHTSKKFMMPALELGGKDAAYVHFDADLDKAVDSVVDGAMFNAGQSCCGIERAYVHEKIYDQFVAKAQKMIAGYKMGDPKNETTSLGPLAQAKAAKVMQEQIDEAVKQGAKVLEGGKLEKISQGTFYPATLVVNVNNKMKLMQEENFGPILPVMKVRDVNEAIQHTNDSHYGLTAAIFTADLKVAQQFAHHAEVGTVFMNRCDYLDPALPWTGVKDSGCGSSLSKYGFYSVTRRKGIHFRKTY